MDAAICLMGCAGLSQSLTEECVRKGDYQSWERLLETSFLSGHLVLETAKYVPKKPKLFILIFYVYEPFIFYLIFLG